MMPYRTENLLLLLWLLSLLLPPVREWWRRFIYWAAKRP